MSNSAEHAPIATPYEHEVITMPNAEPSPLWELEGGGPFAPLHLWRERCVGLRLKLGAMSDARTWAAPGMSADVATHFRRSVVAAEAVLESLERVIDALGSVERALTPSHPIVRYVDAVHGWYAAVLTEVHALLQRGAADDRLTHEIGALASYSAIYLRDHLERLHQRAAEETLHGDVVWLNGELALVGG